MAGKTQRSAKAAGDVVFGFLARGLEEHLLSGAELDQVAQVHIGGVVASARGLLHVVGNDDHRVIGLEFNDQLFDLGG